MELNANSSNNTIFADADGDIAYFHGNFIPTARYQLRLDQAGGWQQSGHRVAWAAFGGRDAAPAEPRQRLALQHQQLAVVRGRAEQPEEGRLSRLRGNRRRIRARAARHPGSPEQEGFHARLPDCRGLRQLSHRGSKNPSPRSIKAWDACAGLRSPEGETGRADRAAAQLGSALGREIPCPRRWPCSGARSPRGGWAGGRGAGTAAEDYIGAARRPDSCCNRWRRPPTGSRPISAPGRRRGARSTASSASPATSCSRSTTRGRAFRWASPPRQWGSLASFGARAYPGTKKWYGTSGNSFVAVVEFGDRVRAKAVTAGGESGHPASPHFNDEAQRYATGNLREVYFYRTSSRATPSASTIPGSSL